MLGWLAVAPAAADWPTYHHDNARTAFDGQQVPFNSVTPGWTSGGLDGKTYAEPLVVGSTVYVATENNSVYAFDVASGVLKWKFNAGAPVPNANLAPGCGNVDPVGITGTPVIDPATGRLYAAVQVNPASPTYQLVTVDINTGNAIGAPVTLTYTGFDAKTQNERGALVLANNTVYVPFGGRIGDCSPYDGVVIGVRLNGSPQIHYTTPTNGNRAGIWATGGVAADASGNLYVATGNSGCVSTYDYDDSVIKLSASLAKLDQWAPTNWASLSCADNDIGSSAPTLLPDLGLIFIQGKEPTGYLLNQSALGSTFSGSTFNPGGEVFAGPGCTGRSFGASAYMSPYIFVPCDNGLVGLKVDPASKTFSKIWTVSSSQSGPPIVVGGAVWNISGGTLHAYDPATGTLRYSHAVGSFSNSFPTPGAGQGRIFVANNTNVQSFILDPICTTATTPTTTAGTGATNFYFAEGFTAFNECLALLMPNTSGTATIDYWTKSGHTMGTIAMVAGQVTTVNVNAAVGANQEVSVKVNLPGPGIAERLLNFNFGSWHGSTDIVGATAPNTEWDFAEGSTLSIFSEYLTLQNPNATAVPATLAYMTDSGAHPSKTVSLPANSRTTVEVFKGDTTSTLASCAPNGAGSNCGVGPGIAGVSVKVTTPSGQPIVAERPFYVNGFSFGSGPINDGHVALGANAPAAQWNFAEGTTLPGFNEYLTLQNPSSTTAASVTLRYIDQSATVTTRSLTVNPLSRFTVEVFKTLYGVGPGVAGVSTQVTSTVPIVAERPMYVYRDFGYGAVPGATDVVGATGLGTLFGFAAASTSLGNSDYLTLQNPSTTTAANVSIDYYTAGGKVTKAVTVNANTRLTVAISGTTSGIGTGQVMLGIVVTSTNAVPILVEKPTYSANTTTYGATDTMGYSPASF
jgi:outer membrane protein assembly factor BamB